MEAGYEGFSIREYTRYVRSVDIRKCCPFPGEFTGDFIQSLLPPLTVAKFRWWSHELTSLLTKSPDDPKPASNAESSPCKKRSIGETTTNDIVLHKKKIKTKKLDDSLHAKTDNKVYNCEELFPDSTRSVSQDCDFEFQIPKTLKVAKRKVCSVRSTEKSNIDASQCEGQVRVCSQMNRLSLSSAAEDQSRKVMINDHTGDNMVFESTQLNKFQPVVSERRLSHARAESGLSFFPGPHLTLERIKDALDLERKMHLAQPNQSSSSASLSQPASVSMHCRTLLSQSLFDPLLVEEAISGFPLNLQGDLVEANGSKDNLFPMFCEPPQVGGTYVVPDLELPPTLLYPCGSLVSCPLTDKDLYFHEYGLGQQQNSVTFSQKQLPFPYNPEISGLTSYYSNVGVGCLLPDARELSFGLPFTSTTQSQLRWPQSSFESSRLDTSYINPA